MIQSPRLAGRHVAHAASIVPMLSVMPSRQLSIDTATIQLDAKRVISQAMKGDEPRLGPRLKGTRSFDAPPSSVPGLVVLKPQSIEREDWYIGEVMAGGGVVTPLLRRKQECWAPPGNLQQIRGSVVLELADVGARPQAVENFRVFAHSTAANLEQAASIRKRGDQKKSVFRPCLELYDRWVAENPDRSRLERLTDHLLDASDHTRQVIRGRSADRHAEADDEAVARSVVNSLRRSAGTNYQGLVALAIAEDLLARESSWYLHHPPPKDYMRAMALRFTASDGIDVDIDPDIDILLKNAAWGKHSSGDEPVVMLSVKTSLADRAGAAARWKMYFDVATRSCPFDGTLDGCAWHDQGIRFAKPDIQVKLKHCIVTANIYKVGSDDKYAKQGELGSAQTRANTFMFDGRFATRVGANVQMSGWEPLTSMTGLLNQLADESSLPR